MQWFSEGFLSVALALRMLLKWCRLQYLSAPMCVCARVCVCTRTYNFREIPPTSIDTHHLYLVPVFDKPLLAVSDMTVFLW